VLYKINRKEMNISELKKDRGWYRGPVKDWEVSMFGFAPKGLGDLIYNTLRKIIEDDDKSEWAEEAFDKCAVLLLQNKRWPDALDPKNSCNNIASSLYYKLKFKLVKQFASKDIGSYKFKFRSQNDMTRDPWVLFYAVCIHLDKREFIDLKPPWRLYFTGSILWELRKALVGKKNNYLLLRKVNDFIHKIFARKDFVSELKRWREWSYDRRIVDVKNEPK